MPVRNILMLILHNKLLVLWKWNLSFVLLEHLKSYICFLIVGTPPPLIKGVGEGGVGLSKSHLRGGGWGGINLKRRSWCRNGGLPLFLLLYSSIIFSGFEVVISVICMLVGLSLTIMQVTVSVAVMQLEVSVVHMQVTVSGWQFFFQLCRWESLLQLCRWYFLRCIMQMTLSIVILQVTFLYGYVGDSFK